MNRLFVLLGLLAGVCLSAALCTSQREPEPVRNLYGQAFAGPEACRPCHQAICDSFISTAHFHDSRPASAATIRGAFEGDSHRFVYLPGIEVRMERHDSGYYQTAYRDDKPYRSEAFGIVIGSGRKGQSYLYWKDKKLYQLPVSYFSPTGSWCNSPGYTADSPVFDRRVPSQCMECHSTQATTVLVKGKEYGDFFDRERLIYGITCERCHGPGARHVAFHTEHPGERAGVFILDAARMGRQQKLDACALCHSGSRYPLKPAFAFRVGDRLNDFSQAKYAPEAASTLDVHGNQYGLLTSSRCFRESQMDCSTCHSPHRNQQGDLRPYSQRCMSCHNGVQHTAATIRATGVRVFADNCIDCHMPLLPSQKIRLELSNASDTGTVIANLVRTHRIAIYPGMAAIPPGGIAPAKMARGRLRAGLSVAVHGYR